MPTERNLPAEWAEQDAIQLTFPHAGTDWADVLSDVLPCFVEIATTISRYQKVIIICHEAIEIGDLLNNAVQENLIFLELPTNDTWARDHGGITVFEGEKPIVLDFVFNGWGLKFPAFHDNRITASMAEMGIFSGKTKHAGIVLEGGGIESDGLGTLLTTQECLLSPNRNPHLSKKQIEGKLKILFGVKRILWLQHGFLQGDDTDSHIDTLARFCDADTIAYVQCSDSLDPHYKALTAMEQELMAFRKSDGSPYRLVPLPWPDACYSEDSHRLPATYANFLIINGAVLVPTYRVSQDAEALRIFEELFPNRKIIGIDCRMLIEQHGSLHCLTMQYPKGSIAEF